jgi:hypothetical protein
LERYPFTIEGINPMTTIITKFVSATNTRGSRIIADAGMKRRITISYHHAGSNPHRDAAIALCHKMGWYGALVEGGMERGAAFVFVSEPDTFTIPPKP